MDNLNNNNYVPTGNFTKKRRKTRQGDEFVVIEDTYDEYDRLVRSEEVQGSHMDEQWDQSGMPVPPLDLRDGRGEYRRTRNVGGESVWKRDRRPRDPNAPSDDRLKYQSVRSVTEAQNRAKRGFQNMVTYGNGGSANNRMSGAGVNSGGIGKGGDLVVNKYEPLTAPKQSLLSTMAIYGRRGSGKSVFVKWFCQYIKGEFPYIYVFTKTKINGFYASFIPEKFIMDHLSDEKLRKILKRQEVALEKFHKSAGESGGDPYINPRVLVIIDDENENIRFNKTLDRFYFHGRHLGIMIIFCAQHWSITPPAVR